MLHHLPFCLTVSTKCKPNNQNQTSKLRHWCCVVVFGRALLLQKNFHFNIFRLTKLFPLKIDSETFCCYLKDICTFSSNWTQNFGKPCGKMHISVLKWALAMVSIWADRILVCQTDRSEHMRNTLEWQCSDKLRRITRSAVRCNKNTLIIN